MFVAAFACLFYFFCIAGPPPRSTLFPYTTLFRSDMQRYFMTVREAVGLVLQASVVGSGDATLPSGEEGGIFVLDMGKPVRSEEHTSELQSLTNLVCRLLLEKKKTAKQRDRIPGAT